MAKDLATKLAFKNLKSQIYKFHEAGSGDTSTKNSSNAHSGNSSEVEITTSTTAILTVDQGIKQCTLAREGERSLLYLNSFEKISTEWDVTCLSDHLELHKGIK